MLLSSTWPVHFHQLPAKRKDKLSQLMSCGLYTVVVTGHMENDVIFITILTSVLPFSLFASLDYLQKVVNNNNSIYMLSFVECHPCVCIKGTAELDNGYQVYKLLWNIRI